MSRHSRHPKSEKEVAREALRPLNKISKKENIEYGVLIYRLGGAIHASAPFTSRLDIGIREPALLKARQELPRGAHLIAYGHTHGADVPGVPSELFTSEDIEYARHLSINAYLATPSDQLVIFKLSNPLSTFPREPL